MKEKPEAAEVSFIAEELGFWRQRLKMSEISSNSVAVAGPTCTRQVVSDDLELLVLPSDVSVVLVTEPATLDEVSRRARRGGVVGRSLRVVSNRWVRRQQQAFKLRYHES